MANFILVDLDKIPQTCKSLKIGQLRVKRAINKLRVGSLELAQNLNKVNIETSLLEDLLKLHKNKYSYTAPMISTQSRSNIKSIGFANETVPKATLCSYKELSDEEKFAETIIAYWDQLGLRKHKDKRSKTYRDDVKSLLKLFKGSLFDKVDVKLEHKQAKFSSNDVYISINNFAKISRNESYFPINKDPIKNLSIAQFLYNPYCKLTNSYFLFCLENEPKLVSLRDDFPLITSSFVKLFREKDPQFNPSLDDSRYLVRAGDRTGNFFVQNEKSISHYNTRFHYPFDQAKLVFTAVTPKVPWDLVHFWVYQDILPKYLEKIGLWRP